MRLSQMTNSDQALNAGTIGTIHQEVRTIFILNRR